MWFEYVAGVGERGGGGICKLRVALIFRLAEVLRKKKPRGRQGSESASQARRESKREREGGGRQAVPRSIKMSGLPSDGRKPGDGQGQLFILLGATMGVQRRVHYRAIHGVSCPPFFQEFHRQRTAVCPDNAPFFFIRPLPLLLTPRFSRTSETMYYYIVWTRIFLDSSSIFLEMKKGIS